MRPAEPRPDLATWRPGIPGANLQCWTEKPASGCKFRCCWGLLGSARAARRDGNLTGWPPFHPGMYLRTPGPSNPDVHLFPYGLLAPVVRRWSRPSPNPSLLLCDAQAYFVHSTTSLSHVSGPGNKEPASRRRRYKVRPWHRNQELRIWIWIWLWLWLVSKNNSSLTTPQTQPPPHLGTQGIGRPHSLASALSDLLALSIVSLMLMS